MSCLRGETAILHLNKQLHKNIDMIHTKMYLRNTIHQAGSFVVRESGCQCVRR